MIKVIPPGSFDFGMPVAKLVDVHSRGIDHSWLVKRAAVLTTEIAAIKPEPGYSYIHLISLGSQEKYGCNRNGDGFNKTAGDFTLPYPKAGSPKALKMAGGLVEFHPTFLHGHVFKHHNNRDPKGAIGEIKAAAYNNDMDRGELIIRVPHGREWDDDLQKLAGGRDIPFSMATKVPFDYCSLCGNQSRTRNEYCDHLKNHMTEIDKAGHQVFAINDRPTFFDISKVIRPADRIAWSLQKVAGALAPMGGAELAEMMKVSAPSAILEKDGPAGYARKMAAARKLAEIEKQIEAVARPEDNLSAACPHRDIPEDTMSHLRQCRLADVLTSLSDAKICLSVRDFLRLVAGSPAPDDLSTVEEMLPGMYQRLLDSGEASTCAMDGRYDPLRTSAPRSVLDLVSKLMSGHSLAEGPAGNRLRVTIIRGQLPKLASHGPSAASTLSKTAQEYAKYQLAFASALGEDPLGVQLTVLGNYLKVQQGELHTGFQGEAS